MARRAEDCAPDIGGLSDTTVPVAKNATNVFHSGCFGVLENEVERLKTELDDSPLLKPLTEQELEETCPEKKK